MGNTRIRLTILIGLFALSLGAAEGVTRHRAGRPAPQPSWDVVPYELGGWSGTTGTFDPIYGTDPADTSLLRIYSRGEAPPVIAYVGFYGNLGKILEVHTPEICYPAQGWTILSTSKTTAGMYRGQRIPASDIVVDKSDQRRLVTWWYNAGSRPFENRIRYVYGMLALSTLTGRTDGAMVRLETPIDAAGETAAQLRISEFQTNLLPLLDQALPR